MDKVYALIQKTREHAGDAERVKMYMAQVEDYLHELYLTPAQREILHRLDTIMLDFFKDKYFYTPLPKWPTGATFCTDGILNIHIVQEYYNNISDAFNTAITPCIKELEANGMRDVAQLLNGKIFAVTEVEIMVTVNYKTLRELLEKKYNWHSLPSPPIYQILNYSYFIT